MSERIFIVFTWGLNEHLAWLGLAWIFYDWFIMHANQVLKEYILCHHPVALQFWRKHKEVMIHKGRYNR